MSEDFSLSSPRLKTDGVADQENTIAGLDDDTARLVGKFRTLLTPMLIINTDKFLLLVMGTNHATPQCQEDVATVIRDLKPETVVLELCASRVCGCPTHRSSIFQSRPLFSATFLKKAMKEIGTIPGMIFFADVYKERQIAEQIHLDYGGEMIRAIIEAKAIGSEIILGDRPIEITLKRQANALSYWKKIQLMVQVNLALKLTSWKNWFLLKASRIVFQDERAFQVLVLERDIFLTFVLQTAAIKDYSKTSKPSIVGVVGEGHLRGIVNYFGKVTPELVRGITTTTTTKDESYKSNVSN